MAAPVRERLTQPSAEEIDAAFPEVPGIIAEAIGSRGQHVIMRDGEDAGGPRNLAEALALFQAGYPVVTKSSEGEIKGTDKNGNPYKYTYSYANLADLSEICLPLLGRCKLAWSCLPTWREGMFWLDYELLFGPTGETRGGSWPLPDPNRTGPQALGSAITYAKRYAFSAATGVAAKEDDDDAAEAQRAHKRREEREDEEWAKGTPAREARPERPAAPQVDLTVLSLAQLADNWAKTPSGMQGAWYPKLGAELARRIDALPDLDAVKAFYREISATCGGDMKLAGERLPWTHEDVKPGVRLQALRDKYLQAQSTVRADLLDAIARANSPERLEGIEATAGREHQANRLTSAEYDEVDQALTAREAEIMNRPTVVPERTSVATGKTVDVELPAEDASADPWDLATPVRPQPAGNLSAEETAAVMTGEPADFSAAYHLLFASIWKGGFESQLSGEIDGHAERGEIDGAEAAALRAMLADRPGYPDSYVRLIWRAELAPNETALDTLKDYAHHLAERSEEPLGQAEHHKVMASIAARRIELRKIPA